MDADESLAEGGLEAPTRHAVDWKSTVFYDQDDLNGELERVFDICHGCRRCVSLCQAFPTLFDLVDESESMEVDGVDKSDYVKVVDQCYLCDLCFMTKCPYVPPHEWNVDFPHLMLRSKAVRFRQKGASVRDRILTSTTAVGRLATIAVVDITVNAVNNNPIFRKALQKIGGIHHKASLPTYHSKTMQRRLQGYRKEIAPLAVNGTTGKVALYGSCYGKYNSPQLGEDFFKVFQHNGIHIELVTGEGCCGMPKLELGDLDTVEKLKNGNIPLLAELVDDGYDLIAPVPSCVLMYKQELPLLFADDPAVKKVQAAFFDPFEYLYLRYKGDELKTDFSYPLGDVSYQVACHLRVQNIGLKTRDILSLVPNTHVLTLERCSGHDGTYAVKKENYDSAVKIARPLVRKIDAAAADHFASDCPMAGSHLASLAQSVDKPEHPMTLLRMAYGL